MLSKHISAGLLMVSEVLEPRPKRRQQFSVYTGELSTAPKSQGLTPGPTRPLYQAFTASTRSHRLRLRQTVLLSRLRTTKSFRSHIHSTSHSQTDWRSSAPCRPLPSSDTGKGGVRGQEWCDKNTMCGILKELLKMRGK